MFTAVPANPDEPNRRDAWKAAGDAQRDRAARRSRKLSAAASDIGPPPPRDQERYERYRLNLFLYLQECFPESTGLSPLSLDHKRIAERTQDAIIYGGQKLFIVFRGFAKSTITENAATWAAGYGHRLFFVPLASTEAMATAALQSIQYEFEVNDHLMALFPEACHAARALEGVPQRAKKQSIAGELTRIEWSARRIVLPTVAGFPGSGAIIWPRGITSNSIRGLRFKRPDGTQERPDFVMGDDLQTDESAANPKQNEKRLKTLTKTIMRLAGHKKPIALTINATIIEPDDMIAQLADVKRFPAFQTLKVPMLKAFANKEAHETHWLGKYAELRTTYNPDDDHDQRRAEREANEYYAAHREAMDAGGVATWPSCFSPGTELSALQHAYNILIDTGEDAFMAECQNVPVRQLGALELLTPDEITRRQSDYPRGTFPAECTTITFHVDVHSGILYCEVWAWAPGMTGYLIDDFTLPDQRKTYFAHRSITRRLKHLFPGRDPEATVEAALDCILHGKPEPIREDPRPGLMLREWTRADGVPMRVRCGLVDANGVMRHVVVRVLSRSPFKANLHPAYGVGITAKKAPISAWAQTREQKIVGPEWVFTKASPGEIPGINFDTNHWKRNFHEALKLPKESQGAALLYKTDPKQHRLAADHYNAEQPIDVSVGSRTVTEFRLVANRDNHRLDNAVGNRVAASRCGVTNLQAHTAARKPRKKRRTTYYG